MRLTVKKRDGPKALIYFGGNAQDVAASLDRYEEWFPHHSIYMVHYRGYGGSTGFPTEQHLYADALAVYEHVKRQHENITILGRSLGSALAIRVASFNPVDRLILVTPFDSIKNVAAQAYPFLPVGLILKDRFETLEDASKVQSPTLLIGASEDNIVRPERTVALMNAMNDDFTELVWIESAGHNTISFSPEFEKLMHGIGKTKKKK